MSIISPEEATHVTVPEQMQAIVHDRFGGPEVLQVATIATPEPGPGEVLVKIRAASINPADWHMMTATPYFIRIMTGVRKPKRPIPGVDLAGRVVAIGAGVTELSVGDEVCGWNEGGAYAEFIALPAEQLVAKPTNATFAEAATLGIAGTTALQGLRDQADVAPGERVLIIGASGGVGTFAVQIAKVLGAEVTAVCSTRNVEIVRGIGADRVVDYTQQDPMELDGPFDVILDNVGGRSAAQYQRLLTADGRLVVISGPKHNRWLGPVPWIAGLYLRFLRAEQKLLQFTAEENQADFTYLAGLIASGGLKPVIDRTYPLERAADAMAYLAEGHAQGKIILIPS